MSKVQNGRSRVVPQVAAGETQEEAKDKPLSDEQESSASDAGETSDENVDDDGPGIKKKLSVKEVVGDIKKSVLSGGIKLPCDLMVIAGIANSIQEGMSSYGPWTCLTGKFQATNMITGEVFIGGKAFVPPPAGDLLVEQVRGFVLEPIPLTPEELAKPQVQQVQKYRPSGQSVEFALVVSAKISDKAGGVGYEYEVRPLIPVSKTDEFKRLNEIINRKVTIPKRQQKTLAAPAV